MSGLEKFQDILLLAFGIFMLVIVSSGDFEFEYGPWGYVAALACIGFGLVRLYKMRIAAKALKSELLEDPSVARFYKHTMDAWSRGDLNRLDKKFVREGALTYEKFVKRHRPIKGGALYTLFKEFPPAEGEYLVDTGDSDSGANRGWFSLTNTRLIQRDGRSKRFKEIKLAEVEQVEMKGVWTKTLHFAMKSGESVDFEKVEMFPPEKYLAELRSALAH
jgi:hypothetical protein